MDIKGTFHSLVLNSIDIFRRNSAASKTVEGGGGASIFSLPPYYINICTYTRTLPILIKCPCKGFDKQELAFRKKKKIGHLQFKVDPKFALFQFKLHESVLF